MKIFSFLALVVISASLLSGCGGGGSKSSSASIKTPNAKYITNIEQAYKRGTWTIMVYLDGDNNLEKYAMVNFQQMEQAGSTTDVRVITQIDRIPGFDSSCGDWTDTRRYLITRDNNPNLITSIRLDEPSLGEQDMGEKQTLRDFIAYCVKNFPADNYCLVLWDHGSGWEFQSLSDEQIKAVLTDDTNSSVMNITDVEMALDSAGIDVLAFDACYMMELEVAYELKNSASYMIASSAAIPTPGFNYYTFLRRLSSKTMPEDLCKAAVEEYAKEYPAPHKNITLAAIDLSRVEELAQAESNFANVLIANASQYPAELADARKNTLNYGALSDQGYRNNIDLIDYANNCKKQMPGIFESNLDELNNALNAAFIAKHKNSDTPKASCMAVYLPSPTKYLPNYEKLQLSKNYNWDNWIKAQMQ